jgi:hypothetical protein
MSKSDPEMTRSRINVLRIAESYTDHSANAVMSAMLRFEAELASAIDDVADSLRGAKKPSEIKKTLDDICLSATKLGADDLFQASRALLGYSDEASRSQRTADGLFWITIAEETRTANIAMFHCCHLFGKALNGKPLAANMETDASA